MAVRGFCHVAIGVHDAQRSLEFYRDVVGLTVVQDGPQGSRRGVYMRWDGPHPGMLVIDQQIDPAPGEAKKMFEIGIHHFAFAVDDCAATVALARQFGCDSWSEPSPMAGPAFGIPTDSEEPVVISAVVRDPDGNYVQFCQWLITQP